MSYLQDNFTYYIGSPVSKWISSWTTQPDPSSQDEKKVAHELFMEAMENIGKALKNIGHARKNFSAEQFIDYMRVNWNQWLQEPQPVAEPEIQVDGVMGQEYYDVFVEY
ncbi:MAG: hypothetical protein JSR46_08020, partial [Verrucomicrobia bacterium]|nr:hypothetical protein [Verrucomicrobiota bacterium]